MRPTTVENCMCMWKPDADGNYWTNCGEGFVFTCPGGPVGHGFKYCPYCGRHIVLPDPETDDEDFEQ